MADFPACCFDAAGFQAETRFRPIETPRGTVFYPAVRRLERCRLVSHDPATQGEMHPLIMCNQAAGGYCAFVLGLQVQGPARRYLQHAAVGRGDRALLADRVISRGFTMGTAEMKEGLMLFFGQDNLHLLEHLQHRSPTARVVAMGSRGDALFDLPEGARSFILMAYDAYLRHAVRMLPRGTPMRVVDWAELGV